MFTGIRQDQRDSIKGEGGRGESNLAPWACPNDSFKAPGREGETPARREEEREHGPRPESALTKDNNDVFRKKPVIAVLADTPMPQNLTIEIDVGNSGQHCSPVAREDKVQGGAAGLEGEGDEYPPSPARETTIPDSSIKVVPTVRGEDRATNAGCYQNKYFIPTEMAHG